MTDPESLPVPQPPVVVKKYANRRLYNTETSSYITLDNLADMIRAGRDFVVYDAKSSEDITRGVLTQIIVEEESKGTSMLPTAFLRQLIGFYGGSLHGVMPTYLETAMSSFARQQAQLRQTMQQTFTPFLPASVSEMSRQNMAVIERALSLFNPFHRGSEPLPPAPDQDGPGAEPAEAIVAGAADHAELDRLRHEVESLRLQLAVARAEAVVLHAPAPAPHAVIVPNVRTGPVLARPVEAPVVATPVVATPVVATPVVAPPVVATPVVATPVVVMPVAATPVVATPVVARSVAAMPVAAKPVVAKLVVAPPPLEQAVAAKTVVATPVVAKTVVATPVVAKPVVATPVVAKPVVATALAATPVVVKPVVATPVVKPVVATAVFAKPVAAAPVVLKPFVVTPPVAGAGKLNGPAGKKPGRVR